MTLLPAYVAHAGTPVTTNWTYAYPITAPRFVAPVVRVVTDKKPEWADPFLQKVTAVLSARQSSPWATDEVNIADLVDALRFMKQVMQDEVPLPWVGVLDSGGVQLTWRFNHTEIEAIFDSARSERAVIFEQGDIEWESDPTNAVKDFDRVWTTSRSQGSELAAA